MLTGVEMDREVKRSTADGGKPRGDLVGAIVECKQVTLATIWDTSYLGIVPAQRSVQVIRAAVVDKTNDLINAILSLRR